MALILYTTEGCHLCELAENLLAAAAQRDPSVCWELVDIANDDHLFATYGWHIPVLRLAEKELRWPFDAAALSAFLS